MRKSPPKEAALAALRRLAAFHTAVDARAQGLASALGDRIRCGRACTACCVDGLTVFRVEAARIREAHPALLDTGVPHSAGACAFLDEDGSCRVYDVRPYVCRTQGLPLRWIDSDGDAGAVERRDICPLNAEGPPIEGLAAEQCWTIGPSEGELFDIAAQYEGAPPGRIALRALFARSDAAGEDRG